MFGYVTMAENGLSAEEIDRYRSAYCGLCRSLSERYGYIGRITLSYDFTFLYLLFTSLYEPVENTTKKRCIAYSLRTHPEMSNEFSAYCADMNLLLSYYKALDNWKDDKNPFALLRMKQMEKFRKQIEERYPEKCAVISNCLHRLYNLEIEGCPSPDEGANATAEMLGIIYRIRQDEWGETLQQMGEGLGRFIYVMDAYEDLSRDLAHGCYNPLKALHNQPNYEIFIRESLTMLIAEATSSFETLPLEKDIHLLRNILYAGCWTRYEAIQAQLEKKSKIPAKTNKGSRI